MNEKLLRDVAWALFADDDAHYEDGEHVPSPVELELAGKLVEALQERGWKLVRVDGSDRPRLYDQRTGQPVDPDSGYPWESMGG